MKKIIFVILLFVFIVCGNDNNSIVGTWEFFEDDLLIKLVFNENPNIGYIGFYGGNYNGSPSYFTWEKKGNFIFIDYDVTKEENTSFEYKGGNTFALPCLDDDCPPFVFTRKSTNKISIVGTWVIDDEYNDDEIFFEENGEGYYMFFDEDEWVKGTEFTYSVRFNEITIFPTNEENPEDAEPYSFIYNGGDIIFIHGDKFIRKENSTAISGKQTIKTKNNFQFNQNKNSLKLNFADNSQKRIEILNLQGKMLKQTSLSAKNASVDISTLSKGIFFLRVFENGKVNSVKFVRE